MPCRRERITRIKMAEPEKLPVRNDLSVLVPGGIAARTLGARVLSDEIYELIGPGPDYLKWHKHSTMVAEAHARSLRELREGDAACWHINLLTDGALLPASEEKCGVHRSLAQIICKSAIFDGPGQHHAAHAQRSNGKDAIATGLIRGFDVALEHFDHQLERGLKCHSHRLAGTRNIAG